MSDLAPFLHTICGFLDECGIAYMLTGSLVSSYYGDPRTTRDLDLVVNATEPPDERIKGFVDLCEKEGFYVATEAALGPWSEGRRQFNVISAMTGWKADIMWVQRRPFSREEFARRREINLMGINIPVPSPEDIVLAKLEWGNSPESRQFADAVSVLSNYKDHVDSDYLRRWSRELGIELLLAQAVAAAQR
jgi:Uncharacterised nucleotidyltransferase